MQSHCGSAHTVEGLWYQVSWAIHNCHAAVHANGAPRIATDVHIGTHTDCEITPGSENDYKVKHVEEILANDRSDLGLHVLKRYEKVIMPPDSLHYLPSPIVLSKHHLILSLER
jgi:hypothetical protein